MVTSLALSEKEGTGLLYVLFCILNPYDDNTILVAGLRGVMDSNYLILNISKEWYIVFYSCPNSSYYGLHFTKLETESQKACDFPKVIQTVDAGI
jgi:predicted secreted protein